MSRLDNEKIFGGPLEEIVDLPQIDIEYKLPDGRNRCLGQGKNGQCKNEAGWNTDHEGDGSCMYHDKGTTVVLDENGKDLLPSATTRKRKGIYDKALRADPKALYSELSEVNNLDASSLSEEVAASRAMVTQLAKDFEDKKIDAEDFYPQFTKMMDTISKVVERSQPKSTLTINTVQKVLMKVIDVVHQEVNDPLIVERIIQKLSTVPLVQK